MELIDMDLKQFDEVLKKYNPVNYYKLQNPLSDDLIDAFMRSKGVVDPNFRLLYQWKNGFDLNSEDYCEIVKWGTFHSIEYILSYDDLPQKYKFWDQTFIPILSNGEGETLLFYNGADKDYGKIYLNSAALLHTTPISVFDSLQTMILTYTESYKQGGFVYSPELEMVNSNDKYAKLANEFNKKSEYWTNG